MARFHRAARTLAACAVLAVSANTAQAQAIKVHLISNFGIVAAQSGGMVGTSREGSNVFYLEDHGPTGTPGERFVALRNEYTGKYLVAEEDGKVFVNRDGRGPWETWTMIDNGEPDQVNRTYSFRSHHGKYLVAEENIAGDYNQDDPNRRGVGPWGVYNFFAGQEGPRFTHGNNMKADRDGIGPWERFSLLRAGSSLPCKEEWVNAEHTWWEPDCTACPSNLWACKGADRIVQERACPSNVVLCQAECGNNVSGNVMTCQDPTRHPKPEFFITPWETHTLFNGENILVGLQTRFDGAKGYHAGRYHLPAAFSVQGDIVVDGSDQWDHVIEWGAIEHGFNTPLRIEVGTEGQWYVSMGDGQSYREQTIVGNWRYGQRVRFTFSYDSKSGAGKFYEEGELIGVLLAGYDTSQLNGTITLGGNMPSNRSWDSSRFFRGTIDGMIVETTQATNPSGNEHWIGENTTLHLGGETPFEGSRIYGLGYWTLGTRYAIDGTIRVDQSDQWDHVLELGTVESGWNAGLRLEVGTEGEWYVSVGDGNSFVEHAFPGSWRYGQQVTFSFQYDLDSGTVEFLENGSLLKTFQAPSAELEGTLLIGGTALGERYFHGMLRDVTIRQLP